MPFSSKAQQKWMFANKPEMAKEWASKTDFKHLPERVKKSEGGTVPNYAVPEPFYQGGFTGNDAAMGQGSDGGSINDHTQPYNQGGNVEDKFSKLKKLWSGGKY
jgi:hypothetical protein